MVGPEKCFVRLCNPRIATWHTHFRLDGARVEPHADIGDAPVRLLRLNSGDRVLQRQALQQIGIYPSIMALLKTDV